MRREDFKIETQLVQGSEKFVEGKPRVYPIYQTTTYDYNSPEVLAELFDLKREGYMYSRIGNPTVTAFEEKIALLEKGVGALALSSGQAANVTAILNICGTGDHIVSLTTIYGGTANLFKSTLKKYGITVTFVSPEASEDEIKSCFKENTKVLFGETLGNPEMNVIDFEKLVRIGKEKEVPVIVDNTLASPYLCNPIEYGVNIVTHSATKYIDGQGAALGGVIVDGGNFNWNNGKFKELVEPDPTYHNLSYWQKFGKSAYITRARVALLRDFGACLNPFNAFIFLRGLETLHLRMERHSENALKIAKTLEKHEKIKWINYPKLESNYSYENSKKYLQKGGSGVILLGIKGGREKAEKFIKELTWIRSVIHIGDSRTCVLHPASTTHRQLTEEEQIRAGVLPEAVRLNVGIENVDDILKDIVEALEKI